MSPAPVLQPEGIVVRHILPRRDRAISEPGERQVLASFLVPQPLEGINGPTGWQAGGYELRLYEEGTFKLTLPNALGGDGLEHIDRFAVLAREDYEPGDEWIEIYESAGGAPVGDPLFVGTPTKASTTTTQIEITGLDALVLQRTTYETTAGFWHHAPRDVFEHYASAHVAAYAEDFEDNDLAAAQRRGLTVTTTGSGTAAVAGGALRLDHGAGAWSATVRAGATVPAGGSGSWRFETRLELLGAGPNYTLLVGLLAEEHGSAYNVVPAFLPKFGSSIIPNGWSARFNTGAGTSAGTNLFEYDIPVDRTTGTIHLAIEQRGRWTHFFADGKQVAVLATATAQLQKFPVIFATGASLNVQSMLIRRLTPFLLRGVDLGDLRVPGRPSSGGLYGEFFDDRDLTNATLRPRLALAPNRGPYASRVDPQISFPSVSPPAWQPAGIPLGEYFSARWTGSIYLDLQAGDRQVRLTGLDDGARIWIGRTRTDEQVIDAWTGGSATSPVLNPLLGNRSGWYPIVVEYRQETGAAGISLEVGRAGAWATATAAELSPQGIYSANVRYDSHFAQLEALRDSFGLQYTLSPRRLESGEFPGQVIPRVREGRDTELVLDDLEGVEAKRGVEADQVLDTLLIDAQGIAADGAQLTIEQIDHPALQPGTHLVSHTGYESLSDISSPALLAQRARTTLELRKGPAEEISARPVGGKRFLDSFPLTGLLAAFDWRPGDGLRVDLPRLRVKDLTPRQLLGASWEIRPAGRSRPQVSFRQRPRNLRLELRDALRKTLNSDRNPQGTIALVAGSLGANYTGFDVYTRASLPTNPDDVLRAELVVQFYSGGATNHTVEVNGSSTGITVTGPGRYDLTARVPRGGPLMQARLTGGDRSYQVALELLIRT